MAGQIGCRIQLGSIRTKPHGAAHLAHRLTLLPSLLESIRQPSHDPGIDLQARGLRPGAQATILARSESTDSLTLEGPLGRVTLGLRPARLIRVLEGEPSPELFHTVPSRDG